MRRGSAVATDTNTIYIAPSDSSGIYCYQVKEDKWTKHRFNCPLKNIGIATFQNEVIAVGGQSDDGFTGKVLTLQEDSWKEILPPLTQPRSDAAVVSTNDCLLSIGGWNGNSCSSVEVLHTGDQAWTSLTSLPTPSGRPSATLTGELICVMADKEHGYFCSLTDLLAHRTWQSLPCLPSKVNITPTLCCLEGQLVTVDAEGTVFQQLGGQWMECGQVSTTYRPHCLLVAPSPDTMVLVGGVTDNNCTVDVCMAL